MLAGAAIISAVAGVMRKQVRLLPRQRLLINLKKVLPSLLNCILRDVSPMTMLCLIILSMETMNLNMCLTRQHCFVPLSHRPQWRRLAERVASIKSKYRTSHYANGQKRPRQGLPAWPEPPAWRAYHAAAPRLSRLRARICCHTITAVTIVAKTSDAGNDSHTPSTPISPTSHHIRGSKNST